MTPSRPAAGLAAEVCALSDRWRRGVRRMIVAVALASIAASPSAAQSPEDPAETARVQVGALAFTPSFSIANFGVDSNVFNEAENPRSDFTATLTPAVNLWLRMGRARFSGGSRLETILFKQYSGQNSLNTVNTGRLEFALNRLRPYVGGSYMQLTERPGLDIDVRARRQQADLELGVLVRLTAKLWARVAEQDAGVAFDEEASFGGRILRESLSRSLRVRRAGLEYDMTPLTRITMHVDQEDTKFRFSPERDASGIRVTPGLEFKPHALVSGQLRVGMLRYVPSDARVPTFTGPTAAINLRYVGIGDTEIVGGADRDLFYSIDAQTYYIQTGVNVGITRHLTRRWSLTSNASKQWVSYAPALLSSAFPASPLNARPDEVFNVSFGAGHRVGKSSRLGFAVAYAHRESDLPWGRYDNLRFFGTMTYGI